MVLDTKKDFEDRVQRMLYGLPNQSITLDRFVGEYEKHSGRKLSSFYGHPKLLKLLEGIPDTVRVCTLYMYLTVVGVVSVLIWTQYACQGKKALYSVDLHSTDLI